MNQDPPSLLSAALDLEINLAHSWRPDGQYVPLADHEQVERLQALPGHPPRAECAAALARVFDLLSSAEFLGDLFHRRDPIGELFLGSDPRGPAMMRTKYPGATDGFTDDDLRHAFWVGVLRMRK
jgi:hypothetical protein